jgi:hypothetical protein
VGTPRSSSPSAQKSPAGPVPTTIGRRSGGRTFAGGGGAGSVSVTPAGTREGARPATNVTSTVWMYRGAPFFRASSTERTARTVARSSGRTPSDSAARPRRSVSGSPSQSGTLWIR